MSSRNRTMRTMLRWGFHGVPYTVYTSSVPTHSHGRGVNGRHGQPTALLMVADPEARSCSGRTNPARTARSPRSHEFSALENHPPLLQNLAHRPYLGAATRRPAQSVASTPREGSPT